MFTHPKVTEIISPFPFGQVVLYLLRGKQNAIIDTGTMNTPETDIIPALNKLGMTLSDINIILNTHGHFDHTGGDATVKAAGAKLYIHPKEASQVCNRKSYLKDLYGPLVTK
jgi:glyoxylase-like metal-dependent hydrolase (beta-lactamase superfamily II)